MRTARVINSAGMSLHIPIDDNDQTAGVTITGEYVGVLQIIGTVGIGGREIELIPYNPDGTVADLEDPTPLDFFLDVGGYTQVRIIAVSLTSGSVTISASTSSAKRRKINESLGEGSGQEVQVTNFPTVQNVVGPLTSAQLRASPVEVEFAETPEGLASQETLASVLAVMTGYDSDGNPLPLKFNYVGSTFTYLESRVQTETRVVDGVTYVRTYTYDGEDLTGSSKWVKS